MDTALREFVPTRNANVIVLVQFEPSKSGESRTFLSYDSLDAAMGGMCSLFERVLKLRRGPQHNNNNNASGEYQYTLQDLLDYLKSLAELVLIEKGPSNSCIWRDKGWVINTVKQAISAQAGGGRG